MLVNFNGTLLKNQLSKRVTCKMSQTVRYIEPLHSQLSQLTQTMETMVLNCIPNDLRGHNWML